MISKIVAAAVALAVSGSVFAETNVALGKATTASTFYSSGTEVFPSANITDGLTTDGGSPSNWSFWLSSEGQNAGSWVQVDLGSTFGVTSLNLFDSHNRGYNDRGTDAFTISVSTDGVHFTNVADGAFTTAQWLNQTADVVTFDAAVLARYVRLTADSTYGDQAGGTGRSAGLAEMQVMAVPEASTSSMALAGLGLLGFVAMRRKANQSR